MKLINPGSTKGGEINDAEFDTNMQPRFQIKLPDGSLETALQKELQHHDTPDVGIVPNTLEQLETDAENISKKDSLEKILCLTIMNNDEKEFTHRHHRLNHLSTKNMFCLIKAGILPKKFLKLHRIPKYASYAFDKAHRRPCVNIEQSR